MGVTTNGITSPTPASLTLLSEYMADAGLGISGHKQMAAIMSGEIGSSYKAKVNSFGSLQVALADALSQALDSVLTYPRGTDWLRRTSSVNVWSTPGKVVGIWVSQASATPVIAIYNSAATATTDPIVPPFTPTAGQFYSIPYGRCNAGIYLTISGTVDCTVFYDPTTT